MRLPLKRGWTLGYISHVVGTGEKRYYVELFTQPWHRWLAARAYHWYDMRVFALPGFKTVEKVKLGYDTRRAVRAGTPEPWQVLPWSNDQDCRCEHLRERGRRVLGRLEIDADTAAQFRKKGSLL